ncbi:hypothetical protein GTP46_28760 [Duganella sp. FT135W]|uniref:Uncharacterized protein n=1 Tax=Duganella flavida TaxID=2692175 RepID=A0A6L8KLD3_9BURK|nr:hypothetical protein [Duganella flavida]MYM26622.1 hypothetical protein [Duganella flavida]
MRQYQINMYSSAGPCRFTFTQEDLTLIRSTSPGRPFSLDLYIAYHTGDHMLALSHKPAHATVAVVPFHELCRKLDEAESRRPSP